MKRGMLQERYMRFVCRMFKYGKLDIQFVCCSNGCYQIESDIFQTIESFLAALERCVFSSDRVLVTYSFDADKYHQLVEIIDNSKYSNYVIWKDVVNELF